MKPGQCDVEQPSESATTLAEWKKPLLVTFVFLTVIMTGFVSYTCVYFDGINPRMEDNATDIEAKDPSKTGTIDNPPESHEPNPCEDESFRSWETYNLNETSLIYRLDPVENFFYFNRPQGPEYVVNNHVCDELKPFGAQLFLQMFGELQSTFQFAHGRDLLTRMNRSDNPWAWSELDSRRYFLNFRNSVLSYVISAQHGGDAFTAPRPNEEEWSLSESLEFECPGIKIADDLEYIEMGWIAIGRATYPDRDAVNLLEFSAVFKSINVWRTLIDCIANNLDMITDLEYWTHPENCTNDTCAKMWVWPWERPINLWIWYQNGQWNFMY